MAKTRLIIASMLALASAACGQLNQGKQAPNAGGGDQAAPAAEDSTAVKPAAEGAAGAGADKPVVDKPS